MILDPYIIISLIFVVTVHEYCHAWMANYLGDPTAKHAGRMSFNPLRHLDPVGTIMIFLVGIGWGKPVPVNTGYFSKPKAHEALTAIAGPLANLVIAVAAAIPIKYFPQYLNPELGYLFTVLMEISLILFVFNMLPFPPLDGSKFIQILIPKKWERGYEKYLATAGIYFFAFLLIDNLILGRYFPMVEIGGVIIRFPLLQYVLGKLYILIKTIIFLGA
jgi:Zn-dependent protease